MANRIVGDLPVLAGKEWKSVAQTLQDFLWRLVPAVSTVAEHNDLDGLDEADAHPASSIENAPAGSISSTTVQGAIDELASQTFTVSEALIIPGGIGAGANLIAWRAPFACTVTKVWGYRVGGTGATINAQKNGADAHLSSDLSLTSADTWMDGGTVQNASYAVGDKLEVMVVTVAGNPTQVRIQVDYQPA